MTSLELVLLGGFQARAAGQPIDVPGRKERALLAFLAMPPGEPRSRGRLCGLLWSDRGDKQAHDSLKQAVLRVRKAFDPVHPLPVLADRASLTLDRTAVAIDVQDFERLLKEGTPEAAARAAALYRGDLLDGLDVRDPAFEEWLLVERQRLRELARDAMGRLVDHHLANGTRDQAAAAARRLLALDPLRESAHRALMQIYAEQGQAALALKQYQICRDALQRELGVPPEAETERLYRSIKEKRAAAPRTPEQAPAPAARITAETDTPPDPTPKPAVAVLPFENMSGDPQQRYFSDAVSEDIITELSRFRSLFVIARHSSFALRDQRLEIADVARKLGVQYVVEGSVLRASERIRITARLIDASSGVQLWADRYDRELRDVFTVRDEVVRQIAAILSDRIDDASAHSARRKRPENLAAYDYFLRGAAHHLTYSQTDNALARQMFEKAIALDPGLAVAYAWLATQCMRDWVRDRSVQARDRAFALAQRSVALDPNDSVCQMMLGYICLFRKQFDDAAFHLNQAVALNPNDPNNAVTMAWFLGHTGRPGEALTWIDQAFRLNPYAPPWYFVVQGAVMHSARRYPEAVAAFNRVGTNLDPADVMYLAACYGQQGQFEAAQAQMTRFRILCPDIPILQYAADEPIGPEQMEHLLDGLRKAGLPD
jgi:TolB-like protein/Tfp pilus assembly protein PilF